jgi:GT2 family glycosyltransferase
MTDPDLADASAVAPPVVALVVTCDPGPWMETTLVALGEQDYPNLSILVIDAGSREDPTPRVAAVLPQAYVRRLSERIGFGAAANQILDLVEGASHYLLCHDDIAPDVDAVRLLVEEAFRSNAGIVAPKVVDWQAPEHLLQVGMSADKTGAPSPLAERGELDQEQHDAVRDVFVAPGGCTLIRADLFASLGGYDPAMTLYGEDLDLSWRAQVAGARVVVAPAARVRHLEATTAGRRDPRSAGRADPQLVRDELRPLQLRHRLRAVLKNYGFVHLVRVVPQIVVLSLAEIAYALVTGRRRTAAAVAGAWTWNLRRIGDLRALRRQVRETRTMSDGEVRRLQVRGSARVTSFVRGQLAGEDRGRLVTVAGRDIAGSLRQLQVPFAVWTVMAIVLLIGRRSLLTGRLPTVGELLPFPEQPGTFLRLFVSGWRTTGLGSEGSAPAAFGFLGLAGVLLFGAMGLLQKLLVLGALPVGIWGASRLARPLDSVRSRLVAAVVYAAVPLPYNAIARGRWSGLLAYAVAPFVLARLLRATSLAPFARRVLDPEDEEELEEIPEPEPIAPPPVVRRLPPLLPLDPIGPEIDWTAPAPREEAAPPPIVPQWARTGRTERWRMADHALPFGLLLALTGALAPALIPVTLIAAAGLLVGCMLVGPVGAGVRAVIAAVGAIVVVAFLLFPWTLEFLLPGANWATFTGIDLPAARGLSLGALMRFETGPVGSAPLGWAVALSAVLPLLVGRGWRFTWAARLWGVAVTGWLVAWAAGRDWLPIPLPSPDALLAPAAAALALTAAIGMLAFEVDISGFRFGWRQAAPALAALAVLVATIPIFGAAIDGRWHLPDRDVGGLLSWMPEQRKEGAFRVLWLGDPEALPLQGWRLGAGLAYGTSRGGPPDATVLWPGSSDGATQLIPDAVNLARGRQTTRLGHLLAPMAVRYVVIPVGTVGVDAARPLTSAMAFQVDLRQLQADRDVIVYENAAWAPARARLSAVAADASRASGLDAARGAELAGSTPVLPTERSPFRFTGRVNDGDQVLLSEASSPGWQLSSGGQRADRSKAFGWANSYNVGTGGKATLRYHTSPFRYVAIALELVLWGVLVRALLDLRRRRRYAESGWPDE